MNKTNESINRIRLGFGIMLVAALTGCGGYIGGDYGGGDYGGGDYGDYDGGGDLYIFGGGYDRGRDVQNYSHRGSASRGAAHLSGSRGGGSHGGHGRRR